MLENVPKIWLGTWKNVWDLCYLAVRDALELCYQHIDTASIYDNEEQVGDWIKDAQNRKLLWDGLFNKMGSSLSLKLIVSITLKQIWKFLILSLHNWILI